MKVFHRAGRLWFFLVLVVSVETTLGGDPRQATMPSPGQRPKCKGGGHDPFPGDAVVPAGTSGRVPIFAGPGAVSGKVKTTTITKPRGWEPQGAIPTQSQGNDNHHRSTSLLQKRRQPPGQEKNCPPSKSSAHAGLFGQPQRGAIAKLPGPSDFVGLSPKALTCFSPPAVVPSPLLVTAGADQRLSVQTLLDPVEREQVYQISLARLYGCAEADAVVGETVRCIADQMPYTMQAGYYARIVRRLGRPALETILQLTEEPIYMADEYPSCVNQDADQVAACLGERLRELDRFAAPPAIKALLFLLTFQAATRASWGGELPNIELVRPFFVQISSPPPGPRCADILALTIGHYWEALHPWAPPTAWSLCCVALLMRPGDRERRLHLMGDRLQGLWPLLDSHPEFWRELWSDPRNCTAIHPRALLTLDRAVAIGNFPPECLARIPNLDSVNLASVIPHLPADAFRAYAGSLTVANAAALSAEQVALYALQNPPAGANLDVASLSRAGALGLRLDTLMYYLSVRRRSDPVLGHLWGWLPPQIFAGGELDRGDHRYLLAMVSENLLKDWHLLSEGQIETLLATTSPLRDYLQRAERSSSDPTPLY